MSFLTQSQLSQDTEFVLRVRFALAKTALAVFYEDAQTANHVERKKWAIYALREPDQATRQIAALVVTQADIDEGATDAEIETAMSSIWDALALSTFAPL